DLRDQGRVPGAVPGVTLQQRRDRVDEERRQRTVRLGQIERAFQGAPGGGCVAERVPGGRLHQEGVRQPGLRGYRRRAVQDRRERSGGRIRIVLREPQRRPGNAYLPAFAVLFA